MKKISFFNVLLFAAAILFAGASFTSCGSDDNKNNPEEGGGSSDDQSSLLVGKWTRTTSESFPGSDVTGQVTATITESYQFKSDKTFEFLASHVTSYELTPSVEQRSRSYGTYSYDGKILTLNTAWTGCWNWDEEKWQKQGEPYVSEFILIVNSNSVTIAPKNQPEKKETFTK